MVSSMHFTPPHQLAPLTSLHLYPLSLILSLSYPLSLTLFLTLSYPLSLTLYLTLFLTLSLFRSSVTVDELALPIIGMSANSDSYSKDCALQAGMNLFLAKPFTVGELQTVLELFQPRRNHNLQDSSCYVTGCNTRDITRNNSLKSKNNSMRTIPLS